MAADHSLGAMPWYSIWEALSNQLDEDIPPGLLRESSALYVLDEASSYRGHLSGMIAGAIEDAT